MKQQGFKLGLDSPASYRIRLQGVLSKSWSTRFGGVNIEVDHEVGKAPVTSLTGQLVDQAALFGVLNSAYDLGFPLLSVECLDEADNKEDEA